MVVKGVGKKNIIPSLCVRLPCNAGGVECELDAQGLEHCPCSGKGSLALSALLRKGHTVLWW